MSERDDLRKLIHDRVVVWGRGTLSSAAEADSFVDLRRLPRHHAGAPLIGKVLPGLGDGWDSDAVGRSTLGIDPVTATLHKARQRGRALDAFVVRKEGKADGPQRRSYRLGEAGRRATAVEDASTIGGSALTAVGAQQGAGFGRCRNNGGSRSRRGRGGSSGWAGVPVSVQPRRSGPAGLTLQSGKTVGSTYTDMWSDRC